MSISLNKFVKCTYELYIGEEENPELVEKATKERPLEYIHGLNMMLPDFEKNLFGLSVGDKFDFVLTAEQAYGEYSDDNLVELPKNIFMNDEGVFDSEQVKEGAIVPMRTQDGHTVQGLVKEIKEEFVIMDFNHPLAGETLHFIGEVIEEHDASEEEMSKFFGGGGCGGGCGCGSHEEEHSHEEDGCGGCCGCGD